MTKQNIDKFLDQKLVLEPAAAGASGSAERLPPFAGGSGCAGGAGAADCLRQRRQPDDGAGGGAGARDGAARLDRRGTMAAGATGPGGKRLAGVSGGGDRAGCSPGGRRRSWSSMINPPDNPARLSLPADWRVLGFGLALTLARDAAVRPGAGAARLGRQAGERAQRRRRPALAAPPDARADRRAGRLLFSGAVRGRPVCRHVRPAVQSAHRLFRRPASHAGYGRAARSAAGLLGPGGRTSARGAGRRDGGAGRLAAAGRGRLERFRFGQRRASRTGAGLLSERLARLDRRHEDSASSTAGISARATRSPGVAIVNETFARQFFNGENPDRKVVREGGRSASTVRSWAWSAMLPTAVCASPSCRWLMFRFTAIDAKGALQPMRDATFIVRTAGANPLALASTLRREVPRARPEFRVSNIRTQAEIGPGANRPRAAAGDAGAVLRGGRAVARGRRPVWRAGLLGAAAAARNRHSHGDRRAGRRHRAAGDGGCLRDGAARGRSPASRWAWHRCDTSRRCSTR